MIRFLLLVVCLALPAAAQEVPVPPAPQTTPGELDEGLSFFEQGARSLLRGLADSIGPGMDEMRRSLDEMKPALDGLGEAVAGLRPMAEQLLLLMDNIGNYELPELLPNGDIVIRRKPAPPEPPAAGEIDL